MTISATHTRKDYVGNGVLATYPFDFEVFASSDLKVYVAGSLQALGVHYTVTGTLPGTGNVVFAAGFIPALNAAIIIEGDTPVTQATDLNTGEQFYEESLEQMVDKATILLQQIKNRALQLPLGHALPGPIPFPALSASKFLRTNPAGTGLEFVNGSLSDIVGVLDDVVPVSADAGFPVAGTAGRLRGKTDGQRGLWMDDGDRWLPIDIFRVDWFGAGGSKTAAENYTAIQAAFTAAAAAGSGGRSVYIPGDAYNIDVSGGPIDTLGVPFYGDGPERTKIFPDSSHPVFDLDLRHGHAGDLSINYVSAGAINANAIAFRIKSLNQCRIHNIVVWNGYRAFEVLSTYGAGYDKYLWQVHFDHVVTSGLTNYAFYFDSISNSTTLKWSNCHVGGGVAGTHKGWWINNVTGKKLSNCSMDYGDPDSDGSVISDTNAQSLEIDFFSLEKHTRTTGGDAVAPFVLGAARNIIGVLDLTEYTVDVGGGNRCHLLRSTGVSDLILGGIHDALPTVTSGTKYYGNLGAFSWVTVLSRELVRSDFYSTAAMGNLLFSSELFIQPAVKRYYGVPVNVAGVATTILAVDLSGDGIANESGYFLVRGWKGGGIGFTDLILLVSARGGASSIVAVSSNDVGAAAARTYSWDDAGKNIKLLMAADTYEVSITGTGMAWTGVL
ncbi:MAG: hypothetical protein M1377_03735 [Deltaproteobacteria bacterium]|nr:hypothetical protein [Deltaproteobacteria bacterium]